MVNQLTTSWDDASMEALRLKWLQGRSAGVIARELNKSRSAIVGKIRRMGLTRRGTTISLHSVRRGDVSIVDTRPTEPAPAPKTPDEPKLDPVSLLDLKRHHCRAIVIESSNDGFAKYCGARRLKDSAWCRDHHRQFHVKWTDYKGRK